MSALLLAAIPALVALIRYARRRYRARPRVPTRPAPPPPPTFRIVALGGSGSGKTVFLSSLFHSLNYRTRERSYYLETDPEQRVALGSLYSNVSDTSQPWPRGTRIGETREFVFDCMAADEANAIHPILRMSYLDYAGELLESAQESGGALSDLAERIDGAHALLAMIDGHRVGQLLRHEPEGRAYFDRALAPMFGFMQRATCPIHLVLTKWDLVRDFGEPADADDQYRLARVIEALMEYGYIKSLVDVRGRHQIVRLIPVSAVGADFVEVDGEGMIVKRPDGRLRPSNVEVPLAAVLPDLFKQVGDSLDPALRHQLDAEVWRQIDRNPLGEIASKVIKGPVGVALRVATVTAFGRDLGTDATMLFVEWMAKPFDRRREKLTREIAERNAHLIERERLRRNVLDDFTRAVMRLEAVLPNSQLSHGW